MSERKQKPYTHFISNKPDEILPSIWNKIREDAERLLSIDNLPHGLSLAGKDGIGHPSITNDYILFNGYSPESCGDFVFKRNDGKKICRFKTNSKPYDLVVCSLLLSIKHHIPSILVSTKGSYSHWEKAIDFYEYVLEREAPRLFEGQAKKISVSFEWADGIPPDDYKTVLNDIEIILGGYAKNIKINFGK